MERQFFQREIEGELSDLIIVSAVATVSGVNQSLTVPSSQVKVPTQFQISPGKTTVIVLEINPGQINISASANLRPVVTPHVSGPS